MKVPEPLLGILKDPVWRILAGSYAVLLVFHFAGFLGK